MQADDLHRPGQRGLAPCTSTTGVSARLACSLVCAKRGNTWAVGKRSRFCIAQGHVPASGRFTGNAPQGVPELVVRVIARDASGGEASTQVTLRFNAPSEVK